MEDALNSFNQYVVSDHTAEAGRYLLGSLRNALVWTTELVVSVGAKLRYAICMKTGMREDLSTSCN